MNRKHILGDFSFHQSTLDVMQSRLKARAQIISKEVELTIEACLNLSKDS